MVQVSISPWLADAASDIGFSQFVIGVGKYFLGFVYFDELAKVEVSGAVGNPRGLLHGVGHYGDGEILAQFSD